MESVVKERLAYIKGFFEEGFLESFLEDNDFVQEIVFFGSFMKGTQHEDSDLDVIIIPTLSFLKETEEDDTDRIQTLLGIHQDFHEGLMKDISLDVKLQEFQNEKEQYGWTYRTGNAIATFYSFIKGEVGQIAGLEREKEPSFSII